MKILKTSTPDIIIYSKNYFFSSLLSFIVKEINSHLEIYDKYSSIPKKLLNYNSISNNNNKYLFLLLEYSYREKENIKQILTKQLKNKTKWQNLFFILFLPYNTDAETIKTLLHPIPSNVYFFQMPIQKNTLKHFITQKCKKKSKINLR